MISHSKRAQIEIESYPHYLGIVLRYYCPGFLPQYNPRALHNFLEWKYLIVDHSNHHCIFWPCWLFHLCPTTNTMSRPISYDNHWHCIYADCPRFLNFVHTPPFFTNLASKH
jgi:hypothetical protein